MTTQNSKGEVNLGIIITPFLDMAFQLLAFFIMTYHPSALEGHIDGNLLPPSEPVFGPREVQIHPEAFLNHGEPDPRTTVVVVVKAVPRGQVRGHLTEGTPTRIALRTPEGGAALEMVADAEVDPALTFTTALKRLAARLRAAQDRPAGGRTEVRIEADGELRHGYLVRVYDICKASRFNNVGFVPPARESVRN